MRILRSLARLILRDELDHLREALAKANNRGLVWLDQVELEWNAYPGEGERFLTPGQANLGMAWAEFGSELHRWHLREKAPKYDGRMDDLKAVISIMMTNLMVADSLPSRLEAPDISCTPEEMRILLSAACSVVESIERKP